jgi:hypothetical protein
MTAPGAWTSGASVGPSGRRDATSGAWWIAGAHEHAGRRFYSIRPEVLRDMKAAAGRRVGAGEAATWIDARDPEFPRLALNILWEDPVVDWVVLENGWLVEVGTPPVVPGKALLRQGGALHLGHNAAIVWLDDFERMTVDLGEATRGREFATLVLGRRDRAALAMLSIPAESLLERWTAWEAAAIHNGGREHRPEWRGMLRGTFGGWRLVPQGVAQ